MHAGERFVFAREVPRRLRGTDGEANVSLYYVPFTMKSGKIIGGRIIRKKDRALFCHQLFCHKIDLSCSFTHLRGKNSYRLLQVGT
jgi:hypothetical protein